MEAGFIGPLPPPDLLRGYEEACPGAADRIIAMAERQLAHSQTLETRMLEAANADSKNDFAEGRLGQVCGLIVALSFIAAGTYVASTATPGLVRSSAEAAWACRRSLPSLSAAVRSRSDLVSVTKLASPQIRT
jgi:uncharacterized membrane protein